MSDFVLYSYQCNPIHVEVDPNTNILPEYFEEQNKKADANMLRHQDYVQELFDTEEEIPNLKKCDTMYFLHRGNYYGGKIVMNQGNVIMLRLQKTRFHEYELDFQMVIQQEQPSSMIIIDNRHEQQRILIERNANTFAPKTIASILEKNIGSWLKQKYSLGFRVPLVFRKSEFWSVVQEHHNGIKKLIFDFPYPNMARPMDKLGASLKKFGVDVRGKVRLVTQAQKKDFLVIEPQDRNEDLDEIVSYLSEVGAPVDIYLVSGRKVKCYSKDNPIVIGINDKIAEFRGEKEKGLFPSNFLDYVTETLNGLKEINYGMVAE
jgi:hypothetical protein